LSGQEDVVIGTPVANRGRVEVESLIGFFVNMLVTRVDVSGRATVGEMLERVKQQAVAGLRHQEIPFEQVVEMVQPVRSLGHSPLFQVAFTWQDKFEDRPELEGLETEALGMTPHVVSKFDLTISLQNAGERIEGGMEYATALFERETMERYVGYYRRVLEGMVAGGEGKVVDEIGVMGEEEREQVVKGWNRTKGELPEWSVQELFEEQVRRRPEGVAVELGEQVLSYAGLNAQANRLAHHLRRCGVQAETRVGVFLERSVEMVVAMLGILKAGAVYVPLDVEYPVERLLFMIEDARLGIIVTETRLQDRPPIQAIQLAPREATQLVRMVCLDGDREAIKEESGENGNWRTAEGELAYVMYTSGSTGRPKGVEVEHRAIKRLVYNAGYVEWKRDEVMLQMAPISFDASTFEIWGALANGLRLVVAPAGALSLEQIGAAIRDGRVTVMWLTAALFHAMVEERKQDLARVRQLLAGGDVLSRRHVGEYLKNQNGNWLINGYGPTEATTFTCCYRMRNFEADWRNVPIGGPIGNTQVYVVDRGLEAVGIGVPGEICVGGMGVARGYGSNPALTAERFVPNPFSDGGERMYRTGDLGRWRKDGTIEFMGRRDEQVKIRGYRIELGEVEGALREQAGVKAAVAIAWVKAGGDKQLMGYVAPEQGVTLTAAEVREGLRKKLPEYMVPMVMVLEELPLTANGKVDRKALPAPEADAYKTRSYEPPQGETEKKVAEIWTEMLKVERVGRHDNFFELGGHSVLAMQVISRLRETLKVEVSLRDLFARSELADFAGGLASAARPELPPIKRVERSKKLRFSYAQEKVSLIDGMEGTSAE
ncbi:MAG TPA: amino acid adenylation domain-containing protein, partial [Candidatus Angelobacter sp.]